MKYLVRRLDIDGEDKLYLCTREIKKDDQITYVGPLNDVTEYGKKLIASTDVEECHDDWIKILGEVDTTGFLEDGGEYTENDLVILSAIPIELTERQHGGKVIEMWVEFQGEYSSSRISDEVRIHMNKNCYSRGRWFPERIKIVTAKLHPKYTQGKFKIL